MGWSITTGFDQQWISFYGSLNTWSSECFTQGQKQRQTLRNCVNVFIKLRFYCTSRCQRVSPGVCQRGRRCLGRISDASTLTLSGGGGLHWKCHCSTFKTSWGSSAADTPVYELKLRFKMAETDKNIWKSRVKQHVWATPVELFPRIQFSNIYLRYLDKVPTFSRYCFLEISRIMSQFNSASLKLLWSKIHQINHN